MYFKKITMSFHKIVDYTKKNECAKTKKFPNNKILCNMHKTNSETKHYLVKLDIMQATNL